MKIELLRIIII